MYTTAECRPHIGKWAQFRSPWGLHRGIIQEVSPHGVLVKVPPQYAPIGFAQYPLRAGSTDEQKLDLALVGMGGYPQYGYSGYGNPGYGVNPGIPGYGAGPGYPGYGYRRAGWWWWWIAAACCIKCTTHLFLTN